MKWRSTTALALTAFVLGLYVLFVEGTLQTTDEAAAAEGRIWLGDSDAVVSVTIERAGAAIVMERTGDPTNEVWRLVTPVADLGDPGEIISMINQVEFAKSPREVEAITDFAQYGTDTPRLTLTLKERSGDVATFRFGLNAPGDKYVYARRDDDAAVLMVEKLLFESLDKEPNHWREKRLLKARKNLADGYVLSLPAGAFEAREVDGLWVQIAPERGRAAHRELDKVFGAIGALKVDEFVEDGATDLARYGLAAPTATVEVVGASGATRVLFGATVDDHIYAMREGTPSVFSVAGDKLVSLAAAARDVRERVFFPHGVTDVTSVTLQRDGVALTLAKESGEDGAEVWKVTAPTEDSADLAEVEEALRSLRKVTVVDFLAPAAGAAELAAYGLEPPLAVLEVKVAAGLDAFDDMDFEDFKAPGEGDDDDDDEVGAGDLTDRFLLGNLTDDGAYRYATRKGEGMVLTVPVEAWELFGASPLRFMSKKVLSFSKWDARELTVARPAGTVRATSDAGAWTVNEPISVPGDKNEIGEVLDLVSALTADAVVELNPKNLATYGLAAPRYVIKVTVKGWEDDAEDTLHEVHFGGDAGGGRVYGYAPERKMVFTLDVVKLGPLDAELVGRKVTGLTQWEVKSLLFERPTGALEIIKVEESWRIVRPEPKEASKPRMEMSIKTWVEGLTAKRVAPETPTDAATYGFTAPRLKWTIGTAAGAKVFVFGANDTADGMIPVQVEGAGLVYFISKEALGGLDADSSAFVEDAAFGPGTPDSPLSPLVPEPPPEAPDAP